MYKYIGDLAVRALKLEAGVTPKPGLVDRDGTGAHKDMDYPLFLASSEALRTCFEDCALAGMMGADPEAFRQIGLAGEQSMYEATNHVNTHKGLIFSMGIFCGALGELVSIGEAFSEKDVQAHIKKLACCLLSPSAMEEVQRKPETHGQRVFMETGMSGIRGEAMAGYPKVFQVGIPTLRQALDSGLDFERVMIRTLLTLMCQTEDSNLVYRGGRKGLRFIQEHAAAMLSHIDLSQADALEQVKAFDEICIEKNLSPGGSADLLALTAMIYLFFEEKKRKEGEE